jgi:hypothetical protein
MSDTPSSGNRWDPTGTEESTAIPEQESHPDGSDDSRSGWRRRLGTLRGRAAGLRGWSVATAAAGVLVGGLGGFGLANALDGADNDQHVISPGHGPHPAGRHDRGHRPGNEGPAGPGTRT